jgi:hypothetical protein
MQQGKARSAITCTRPLRSLVRLVVEMAACSRSRWPFRSPSKRQENRAISASIARRSPDHAYGCSPILQFALKLVTHDSYGYPPHRARHPARR